MTTTSAELTQFGEWMSQLGWLDRGKVARHQLWVNIHTGRPYRLPLHATVDLDRCASEVALLSPPSGHA